MSTIEIIMIGLGLSMDAVAVSMTNGMVYKDATKSKIIAMPLFFGLFQGFMPLLGYYTGGMFSEILSKYAGILILIILGFIGANMLKEGFFPGKEKEEDDTTTLTYKLIFFQAIATSIDAFAVGIGFNAMNISILPAVCIICITTFLCSFLAIFIGKKFGDLLGKKAEILGGIILIIIATKGVL